MKAYIFPGQGSQFPGMGVDLHNSSPLAKELFEKANDILGFPITETMFNGTEEDLKQTKVTQPAIFLHSVITAIVAKDSFDPKMVAGHSLGEFSALVANKTLLFEDGLKLVFQRAQAMQKACELQPSTMAAVIGLANEVVEQICNNIEDIVVPANYNCPGQIVISGSRTGIEKACKELQEAGARRAMVLNVGGAFHSPLMEPARVQLEDAIHATEFGKPLCPIFQNVTALPTSDPITIKENLVAQLTAPVKWTQTIENMLKDGASSFTEVGPGNVLKGLVKKVDRSIDTFSL
jgi:[acyl-carrier-protein] S-malonyltransferase